MESRPRKKSLGLLWLLVVLVPLFLGPAMLPLEQLVAEAHHVCACGMAVGTCGCPDCEALERAERLADPPVCPVLKGSCEHDTLSQGAHYAPPLAAPALTVSPTVLATLLDAPSPSALLPSPAPPPPTEPPRPRA